MGETDNRQTKYLKCYIGNIRQRAAGAGGRWNSNENGQNIHRRMENGDGVSCPGRENGPAEGSTGAEL